MCEFDIKLSTVEEVKAFVQVATVQPFEVYVTTPRQKVSAKSFIGMFSLDGVEAVLEIPLSEDELSALHASAQQLKGVIQTLEEKGLCY